MQHLLIDLAKKYTPQISNLPETDKSFAYDIEKGYWIIKPLGKPLVDDPRCKVLATKKYDRETGEDMKGE